MAKRKMTKWQRTI